MEKRLIYIKLLTKLSHVAHRFRKIVKVVHEQSLRNSGVTHGKEARCVRSGGFGEKEIGCKIEAGETTL